MKKQTKKKKNWEIENNNRKKLFEESFDSRVFDLDSVLCKPVSRRIIVEKLISWTFQKSELGIVHIYWYLLILIFMF